MNDDIYYDRAELIEAQKAPEYATSARYRDEVAAKLARSLAAGTVTPMGAHQTPEQRTHTVHAVNLDEGIYGGAQPMPKPASPFGMNVGTFKTLDEITAATSVDSYRDPTYRRAVTERIQRSIREETLEERALAQVAAWQAEAEAKAGL